MIKETYGIPRQLCFSFQIKHCFWKKKITMWITAVVIKEHYDFAFSFKYSSRRNFFTHDELFCSWTYAIFTDSQWLSDEQKIFQTRFVFFKWYFKRTNPIRNHIMSFVKGAPRPSKRILVPFRHRAHPKLIIATWNPTRRRLSTFFED